MGCVCSSMVDWVHYYGLHEFQECSELGRITFESSSIQLQALFFSQKALYELHLVFSFGPQSCKNLWKQKKTLLEPLFSTRYQFMKQYWELWSFDPWFTVLDVNVLSSMPESKWKAQPQENLCDPSNWFMTSNFGKIGESPELA